MPCEDCRFWMLSKVTRYGGGKSLTTWRAPTGKGECVKLAISTEPDFACNRYAAVESGDDHVDTTYKPGEPWQHFEMVKCPDCQGKGSGTGEKATACYRCAGTANVRKYDDGFVGDERTRKHPEEIKLEKANALAPSLDADPVTAEAMAAKIKALEQQISQMRSSPLMQSRAKLIESSGPMNVDGDFTPQEASP